ncbi:MAG: DUF2752 domain-containing protein [Lachnospiraceae bacterium]|nr:DUF2752 domain-containing protein [Lachnospiraceae bacterium]
MKVRREDIIIMIGVILAVVLFYALFGCPIKRVTGLSCPGCGMTRAWLSLLHGSVHEAFHYHPLFITAPFIVMAVLFGNRLPEKYLHIFWCVIAAAFIVCYVIRIVNKSDVLEFDFRNGVIGRILYGILSQLR